LGQHQALLTVACDASLPSPHCCWCWVLLVLVFPPLLLPPQLLPAAHAGVGVDAVPCCTPHAYASTGVAAGVPWPAYRMRLCLAGEVFSEEWRSLVAQRWVCMVACTCASMCRLPACLPAPVVVAPLQPPPLPAAARGLPAIECLWSAPSCLPPAGWALLTF
jgi:hypothetical protein